MTLRTVLVDEEMVFSSFFFMIRKYQVLNEPSTIEIYNLTYKKHRRNRNFVFSCSNHTKNVWQNWNSRNEIIKMRRQSIEICRHHNSHGNSKTIHNKHKRHLVKASAHHPMIRRWLVSERLSYESAYIWLLRVLWMHTSVLVRVFVFVVCSIISVYSSMFGVFVKRTTAFGLSMI